MRFDGRTAISPRARGVVLFMLAVLLTAACSRPTTSPSSAPPPVNSPPSLVGPWSGTITTPGIADGTVVVVISAQIQVPLPAARGTYEIVFPDPMFGARGGVTVDFDPTNSSRLLIVFDPAPVPCPGASGGVKLETRTAVMTLTGNRASGSYLTGSCPFGTITLIRQ